MIITIYFDHTMKNFQVLKPKQRPECKISDIVNTITGGNYYRFTVTN